MLFTRFFNRMSFKVKILLLSLVGIGITSGVLTYAVWHQRGILGETVLSEVDELGQQQCAVVVKDVHSMLTVQAKTIEHQLLADLNVARDVLAEAGEIRFSSDQIPWSAVNQSTKEATEIALPKMEVGGVWLGQNTDAAVSSPVVDKVKDLVGGTCTIFQRINEAGDMLRVCTNVEKLDGTRAIGTYIPAVDPGGKPNAVISAVLQGKTFTGRAFVVNAWYVAAYEPICDDKNEVIGVLFVGIQQENVPQLRQGIMDIVVGKPGDV